MLIQRRASNPDLSFSDSIHPLLQQVYSQRSIQSVDELELGFSNLLSPQSFKDMNKAVSLLADCLKNRKRILIVADFDADGATSCVLAMNVLRQFGAQYVDYIVPNRFEFGYGLTPEIVELAKLKKPDLIITVDNGISSIDGVTVANKAGIDVLITDHHIAPENLPAAQAIINPNQAGCAFVSKCIAGVGVIFYVMLALRTFLRKINWFVDNNLAEPNLAHQLDLVALGTIADVVALDRNNRILVDEGLKRIRMGRTRPGIIALLQIANRNPNRISASDLGFSVGPRLNAAGRLEDMSTGIECLLAESASRAHALALALDGMNQDRKQIEAEMRDQAFASLKELSLEDERMPPALCLYDERWHQGVVGIVASRIKDKYHRPVIAFAQSDNSEQGPIELKGSARSVSGFHIRDALDAVATKNPGLISKFGGHAMAAGLSLDLDKLEQFEKAFAEHAASLLSEDQLQAKIMSDGLVDSQWLSLESAAAIDSAGPWGQAFPEPLFDGRFNLLQQRRVGERHLKMVLSPVQDPQRVIDGIAFNVDAEVWPNESTTEIEIAYRLSVNEFRGAVNLQLIVEHILATV
ncbi:MAG: single-stranded-DNA-specific exonuclease RecJ [Gammaproteobacteria bacterium]|nr:single-stranded-DNA-specific exonuclease RecJ [Gammaproteobacteria bacterium]